MMLQRARDITILCLLLLALIACARPAETASLADTEWVLTSLQGRTPLSGTQITLQFTDERASGYAGCNHYGGEYTLPRQGKIEFGMMQQTVMLCFVPEGVIDQEVAYMDALRQATAYRIGDDTLELQNEAGEILLAYGRRVPLAMDPAALIGTRWQITPTDDFAPVEGYPITLAFPAPGQISGLAGYRGYRGTYEAEGDTIRFPMLEMTGTLLIVPEAALSKDGEYTTQLQRTRHYRLTEDRLELLTVQGKTLVFAPLPADVTVEAPQPEWMLEAFVAGGTETAALTTTEVTIAFADDTVSGSAGCNRYRASLGTDGSFLQIGPPLSTKMNCEGEIMQQETRFLNLLPQITIYRVIGDQLRLETPDGQALLWRIK